MGDLEYIFDAEKGKRILRGWFMGIVVEDGHEPSLWWCIDTRCWLHRSAIDGPHSNTAPCRSFKAFKRHVRKHHAALAGRRVVLVNRFVGYDVTLNMPDTPNA